MKIIGLNIQHGGGKRRAPALIHWLTEANADLVVLTEWRQDSEWSLAIKNALGSSGLIHVDDSDFLEPKRNGILIASRRPIFGRSDETPTEIAKGCLRLVKIGHSLRVLAAYIPPSGDERQAEKEKRPFFDRSIELARKNIDRPFLLIGDLNTGNNDFDRTRLGAKFYYEKGFIGLESARLRDLWRENHGGAREFSYESGGRKNSFRVDHAFGNAHLQSMGCHYDHSTRAPSTVTDHSALVVHVDEATVGS
jgi:exodeoxyribonuclease III